MNDPSVFRDLKIMEPFTEAKGSTEILGFLANFLPVSLVRK